MVKKVLYGIIILTIIILITVIIMLKNDNQLFMGLEPKAVYKNYKIYDVIEQKNLPCAEAIEILDSDAKYNYYFNCLKSAKIYFVSDSEVINVHEAYNRKIITKEKLYELGIVDRMVKSNAE